MCLQVESCCLTMWKTWSYTLYRGCIQLHCLFCQGTWSSSHSVPGELPSSAPLLSPSLSCLLAVNITMSQLSTMILTCQSCVLAVNITSQLSTLILTCHSHVFLLSTSHHICQHWYWHVIVMSSCCQHHNVTTVNTDINMSQSCLIAVNITMSQLSTLIQTCHNHVFLPSTSQCHNCQHWY